MHFLYRITNKINGKNYIGQSKSIRRRWSNHRRAALTKKPTQIVHRALIKYGLENFDWEILATCRTQEEANDLETILVGQYQSFVMNNGYNSTYGGMNAPKSDEWKEQLSSWHASLSVDEKQLRSEKLREATIKQIQERGHPAQGTKRTEEQRETLSYAQQNRNNNYTDEMRRSMSEKQKERFATQPVSAETIEKRRLAIAETVRLRHEREMLEGKWKCHAPGCTMIGHGACEYLNYQGLHYCPTHGSRLKKNCTLEYKSRAK